MSQSRWWEQQIPIEGTIQKGELLTYNLTELIKPESYLVRLTPITRFGEGDTTERTISYSSMFVSSFSHSCSRVLNEKLMVTHDLSVSSQLLLTHI